MHLPIPPGKMKRPLASIIRSEGLLLMLQPLSTVLKGTSVSILSHTKFLFYKYKCTNTILLPLIKRSALNISSKFFLIIIFYFDSWRRFPYFCPLLFIIYCPNNMVGTNTWIICRIISIYYFSKNNIKTNELYFENIISSYLKFKIPSNYWFASILNEVNGKWLYPIIKCVISYV